MVTLSRYWACFPLVLFVLSCAGGSVTTASRNNRSILTPVGERVTVRPSPFALTVSRYPESSRLVAWGHIVWPGRPAPEIPMDWALLVDNEMINYLLSVPLKPEVLEKVGANSDWSPYLLRWKSPDVLTDEEKWVDFVTSFQMRTSQFRQTKSSGLPILDRAVVENHLRLFEKITSVKMTIEGFVSVP